MRGTTKPGYKFKEHAVSKVLVPVASKTTIEMLDDMLGIMMAHLARDVRVWNEKARRAAGFAGVEVDNDGVQ